MFLDQRILAFLVPFTVCFTTVFFEKSCLREWMGSLIP